METNKRHLLFVDMERVPGSKTHTTCANTTFRVPAFPSKSLFILKLQEISPPVTIKPRTAPLPDA